MEHCKTSNITILVDFTIDILFYDSFRMNWNLFRTLSCLIDTPQMLFHGHASQPHMGLRDSLSYLPPIHPISIPNSLQIQQAFQIIPFLSFLHDLAILPKSEFIMPPFQSLDTQRPKPHETRCPFDEGIYIRNIWTR